MICLLMFFLAVVGAIISYKKTSLMVLQELAFGSEFSTKYHVSRIRHVASLQLVCCSTRVVSEMVKMVIHCCVSPNAVFPMNLFWLTVNTYGVPLKYVLHFAFFKILGI